jgi:hypothetical protein
MRRLPADRWLSRLLDRGEATPELMRRIARRIAAFHAGAATDERIRRLGGLETVRRNTGENFSQTREYVGLTIDAATFDRVEAYTEAFLEVNQALFARREREGRIRDCHGDLHADQICVENGIAFIDCIEFNERFRYSDLAADIAFPAMDVEYHGAGALADELVREYVAASGDEGALAVLGFYRCYRAFTRGKVRSFRLRQELAGAERRLVIEQASRYFDLAGRYARLEPPFLLAVGGLMGTGKTTVAGGVGLRLGAAVLSSDVVRKELAGLAPDERRAEPWGGGIYTGEFTERTYAELRRRAGQLLGAGSAVIVDASYRLPAWRSELREAARAAGARFLFLQVVCPISVARERLAGRRGGASDGRPELLAAQAEAFTPPTELPAAERIEIDSSATADATVRAALGAIYRRWLAPPQAAGP